MNVSLAITAALYGATVVNHLEVTGLERDASGKLCGARVKDLVVEMNGGKAREFEIRAKAWLWPAFNYWSLGILLTDCFRESLMRLGPSLIPLGKWITRVSGKLLHPVRGYM